jgi:hypothetical protein
LPALIDPSNCGGRAFQAADLQRLGAKRKPGAPIWRQMAGIGRLSRNGTALAAADPSAGSLLELPVAGVGAIAGKLDIFAKRLSPIP